MRSKTPFSKRPRFGAAGASKFYDDIIKVEDAFPVRLADNRLIGLSVHRFGFSGQRLAGSGVKSPDSVSPRRRRFGESAGCERLPFECLDHLRLEQPIFWIGSFW